MFELLIFLSLLILKEDIVELVVVEKVVGALEEELGVIWELVRVLEDNLVANWDFDVGVAVKVDEGELGEFNLAFLETFSSLITETTQRFIPVGLRIIRVLGDAKHFTEKPCCNECRVITQPLSVVQLCSEENFSDSSVPAPDPPVAGLQPATTAASPAPVAALAPVAATHSAVLAAMQSLA